MKISGTIKEIISELLKLDMDKLFVCEIKEPKSKRSLEQNKLLWSLIHKIAKKTYQDDMEVYCTALERADAKSDYVITAFDMESTLRKSFRGVKFIRMQEVNNKDCYVYKVYIGSSKMSTKEMTELLEIVFQMCSELQIPTMEDLI
jgi:predicted nucleic acid-binding protein